MVSLEFFIDITLPYWILNFATLLCSGSTVEEMRNETNSAVVYIRRGLVLWSATENGFLVVKILTEYIHQNDQPHGLVVIVSDY